MFVFLRRQGWGFEIHVLLLNKKGTNVKAQKEVSVHNFYFQNCIVINYENIFLNEFLLCCVDLIVKELQEHREQQTNERKKL